MGLLRFILAFAVMVGHYKLVFTTSELDGWLPYMQPGSIHGAIKVNSFFVISGFYTQMLLETKFARAAASQFYVYRVMRLLPTYYLCLFLLLLLSLWAEAQGLTASRLISPEHMSSPGFWLKNITLYVPAIFYVQDLHWYDVPHALALRQSWTLSNEFALIIFCPLLLKSEKKFRWAVAAAALMAIYYYTQDTVRDYLGATAIYFVLGAVGYKFYRKNLAGLPITRARSAMAYAMVAAIAGMLIFYHALETALGDLPAYLIFMATVILCVPPVAAFTREFMRDRRIGYLSYPMYMFHFLFYSLLEMYAVTNGFIYAFAGVIVCSVLTIRFIENPLRRYRREKFPGKA